MLESGEDFYLPECPLAIRLMFERRDFLDGDFCYFHIVKGGPVEDGLVRYVIKIASPTSCKFLF